MKSVISLFVVILVLAMALPLMAEDPACTPGGETASAEKSDSAKTPVIKSGVHIAFTVPIWLLAGFGSIAYPSIGAFLASFLMRASNRRIPGYLVAALSFAWPATLASAVAAFPVWMAYSLTTQYGGALKGFLAGRHSVARELARFCLHESVQVAVQCQAQDGYTLNAGLLGTIRGQEGRLYRVDIPGHGTRMVDQDNLMRRA